jgi:ATP-dependent protease Clp ATPase subunit
MTRCSFCSKPESEIKKMVEGPGVFICNECITLAESIVTEHIGSTDPARIPWWDSLSDEEMLARLPRMLGTADQIEASMRTWVQELRKRGVTWARIGQSLGMTRQSAWERFSGEE